MSGERCQSPLSILRQDHCGLWRYRPDLASPYVHIVNELSLCQEEWSSASRPWPTFFLFFWPFLPLSFSSSSPLSSLTGSLCVARPALNSWFSCLHLLNAEMIGIYCYIRKPAVKARRRGENLAQPSPCGVWIWVFPSWICQTKYIKLHY